MTTTYDMFETSGRGPRKRRRTPDTVGMIETTETSVLEALPSVCEDSVLMAEIGASVMCIGYYVGEIYGDGNREFGDAAPIPALRAMEEFGPKTSVRPFALAMCAAALARISANAEVHERAERIIRAHGQKQGYQDLWPAWRELPLVTPEGAWVARDEEGRTEMLVTSWRDANDRPHAFATSSYDYSLIGDECGQAIDSIFLGDSAEEILDLMRRPIDDLPGMQLEQISLGEAHELLSLGIDDVSLAARRMLPRDLPMTTLAFLEHRRDLLEMSVGAHARGAR